MAVEGHDCRAQIASARPTLLVHPSWQAMCAMRGLLCSFRLCAVCGLLLTAGSSSCEVHNFTPTSTSLHRKIRKKEEEQRRRRCKEKEAGAACQLGLGFSVLGDTTFRQYTSNDSSGCRSKKI